METAYAEDRYFRGFSDEMIEARVRLISVTPDAERTIGYCARVSNPENQENQNVSKLLAYCIKYHHWSIFEMANMVVEITTSRAISQQILRHRSFSFQEFSQRYAPVQGFERYRGRRQDERNRQNSIDDLDEVSQEWFQEAQTFVMRMCQNYYEGALEKGIAKEVARFLLPLSTMTKLYMNGTVRSWIHYLQLRTGYGTQEEHQEIAREIRGIFRAQFPSIAEALGWVV